MTAQPTARMSIATPLGPFLLEERDGLIVSTGWTEADETLETPLLAAAARQLAAYFDRRLRDFDLPLAPSGSDFDQAVWREMCRIPYGETLTYGDVARRVGGDARSVGGACGRNPIPIIIPCHRIVAGGGRSGGYSGRGGVETKSFLLALEGALLI